MYCFRESEKSRGVVSEAGTIYTRVTLVDIFEVYSDAVSFVSFFPKIRLGFFPAMFMNWINAACGPPGYYAGCYALCFWGDAKGTGFNWVRLKWFNHKCHVSPITTVVINEQTLNSLSLRENRHLVLCSSWEALSLQILFLPSCIVCDITGTLFPSIRQVACFALSIWQRKKRVIVKFCLDGTWYMLTEEIFLPTVLPHLSK